MAISRYTDEKDGQLYFKVRVVRMSPARSPLEKPSSVEKVALKIKTEEQARKTEKKLIAEAERQLVETENQMMTWESLVHEWYEECWTEGIFSTKIQRQSLENYLAVIREHTWAWRKLRIDELDKAVVWRTLEKIEKEGSVVRRKKVRTAVDAVFKFAILSGRIKNMHTLTTEGFKGGKQEEKLPEILTLDQIRDLIRISREQGHNWHHVWTVALLTGMRSGELFALEWPSEDLDAKNLYVHKNWTSKRGFHATKGKYWRTVPLNDDLVNLLKEIKRQSDGGPSVLPRYQAWKDGRQALVLQTFCAGYGLPPIKFHTLRACFATQLMKDGVAQGQIMKICGWKDLKTMQRYIRLAGIEVKGATDTLKIMPDREIMGRVIELFSPN